MFACFLGCADIEDPVTQSQNAIGSFKFPLSQTQSSVSIDRVTITVSGPGMENISQDLTISGNQAAGFIEVPPGENRVFRAEAFLGTIIYYSGASDEVDISANQELTVNITLTDLTPSIELIEPSQ